VDTFNTLCRALYASRASLPTTIRHMVVIGQDSLSAKNLFQAEIRPKLPFIDLCNVEYASHSKVRPCSFRGRTTLCIFVDVAVLDSFKESSCYTSAALSLRTFSLSSGIPVEQLIVPIPYPLE